MWRTNLPTYLNGGIWQISRIIALIVFIFITATNNECEAGKKYKIVILPFKDHSEKNLGVMLSDVLRSTLTQKGYFEAVDRDKIYETVVTVIPGDLIKIDNTKRVGKSFTADQIDLMARLDVKNVQKFCKKLNADYAIKGSVSQLGENLRIDAEIIDVEANKMLGFVDVEGKLEELSSKIIEELSNKITLFCRDINAYDDALAIRGKYNQGQYTYDITERKLKESLSITKDKLAIHAVLMVLYISEIGPGRNIRLEDKILEEGHEIITLLNQNYDEKYLEIFQTSGFDPFDEMANIYSRRDNNKKAIEIHKKAIIIYPMNIAGHYKEMGLLYLKEGTEDIAIKAFEKSLGVNKSNYELHFILATIFEKKGTIEKAVKHLEECIKYARNVEDIKAAKEKISNLASFSH